MKVGTSSSFAIVRALDSITQSFDIAVELTNIERQAIMLNCTVPDAAPCIVNAPSRSNAAHEVAGIISSLRKGPP